MIDRKFIFAALILPFIPSSATAGLIIRGVDTEITAGSTGEVLFTIETDGVDTIPPEIDQSADDFLTEFKATFEITTESNLNPRRLEFANTSLPALGDPGYVLGGISLGQLSNEIFAPTETLVPNDTLLIEDMTIPVPPQAPTLFATLTLGSPRILARLQVTTLGALAPEAKDSFLVNLLPPDVDDFLGPSVTNAISIISPARVTITAATSNVVPEPVSALSWSMICVLGLAGRRRRR